MVSQDSDSHAPLNRTPPNRAPLPGFFAHLHLLWQTRSLLTRQSLGLHQSRMQALLSMFALLPAVALGTLTYWFMTHPTVNWSVEISQFYMNLLCFITALLWISWPVLSAGVEDASESKLYQSYPISTRRLLVAATLSSLLRPVGLFMFAPLIGAVLGYSVSHLQGFSLFAPGLLIAYIALCAGWSQAALFWVREVLRSNRNGQVLGVLLLVLVILGLTLPPVDISWLYQETGGGGAVGLDLQEYANIAYAFSRVPFGYLGEGLRALHDGRTLAALADLVAMLILAALGLLTAQILLSNSQHGKARHSQESQTMQTLFLRARNAESALARREALTLWRNPRARLLFAVPFVLMVLLRLFSAHDMFVYFFGAQVDTWLMAVLGTYAALLMAITFAHNSFSDDGQGLYQLLASPVTPVQILSAKAKVHAISIGAAGGGTALFYAFYIGQSSLIALLIVLLGLLIVIPLTLILGLFLSIYFPVSSDTSLNRRNRQPLLASLLGMTGTGLAAMPLFYALQQWQLNTSLSGIVAALGLLLLFAILIYRKLLPIAAQLMEQRRELILATIARY